MAFTKNKKFRIFAGFILVVCSIIFTINISSIPFHFITREYPQYIKNSATNDTIIIKLPEDKTYTKPMAGYYPATYGFENDNIGDIPEGWLSWVSNNPDPKIISSIGFHNKVAELRDQSGSGQTSLDQIFNMNKTSGTIEIWFYSTDITQRIRIYGRNSTHYSFHFKTESSSWQYNNGSAWKTVTNVAAPQNYRWMHIRIDFECSNGEYLGLGNDEYYLTIDGIKSDKLSFENKMNEFHRFGTCSGVDATGFYFYIDAVGYSWNPAYEVGDNLNEGLLLGFENKTSLDWIGYSLDGQANKTILGNTTLPMPAVGLHSIQVFGNDTIGTMYESEVRNFSIGTEDLGIPIEIIIIVSVFGSIIIVIIVIFIVLLRKRPKISAPKRFKIKSKRE